MKPKRKGNNLEKWLVGIIILWFVIVVSQGIANYNGYQILGVNFELSGQFGDSFGALSAIMAGLAAIGAWRTLVETRNQAREATFFESLALLNSIVTSTDIQSKSRKKQPDGTSKLVNGDKHEGRDAYKRLVGNLRKTIKAVDEKDKYNQIIIGYKRFFEK